MTQVPTDTTDYVKRAQECESEAEREQKGGGGGCCGLCCGWCEDKYEREANVDRLLEQAANYYKVAGDWGAAAKVFDKLAAWREQRGEEIPLKRAWSAAARCYASVPEPSLTLERLEKVHNYHVSKADFRSMAKCEEEMGDLCATGRAADVGRAGQLYLQAAGNYDTSGSKFARNDALKKRADLLASCGRYDDAAAAFDELVARVEEACSVRGAARGAVTSGVLCQLCVDATNAEMMLREYGEAEPGYQDTQAYQALTELIHLTQHEATREQVQAAAEAINNIHNKASWYRAALTHIVKNTNVEEDSDDLK